MSRSAGFHGAANWLHRNPDPFSGQSLTSVTVTNPAGRVGTNIGDGGQDGLANPTVDSTAFANTGTAGFAWVRIPLWWGYVENPAGPAGVYNHNWLINNINAANSNGISNIVLCCEDSSPLYDAGGWPNAGSNALTGYKNYIVDAVTYVKNNLSSWRTKLVWELQNEIISAGMTTANVANMCSVVADAIHAADASAKVIMPSMNGGIQRTPYINTINDASLGASAVNSKLAGLAIHPYCFWCSGGTYPATGWPEDHLNATNPNNADDVVVNFNAMKVAQSVSVSNYVTEFGYSFQGDQTQAGGAAWPNAFTGGTTDIQTWRNYVLRAFYCLLCDPQNTCVINWAAKDSGSNGFSWAADASMKSALGFFNKTALPNRTVTGYKIAAPVATCTPPSSIHYMRLQGAADWMYIVWVREGQSQTVSFTGRTATKYAYDGTNLGTVTSSTTVSDANGPIYLLFQ